jgi:hypothetical protein
MMATSVSVDSLNSIEINTSTRTRVEWADPHCEDGREPGADVSLMMHRLVAYAALCYSPRRIDVEDR